MTRNQSHSHDSIDHETIVWLPSRGPEDDDELSNQSTRSQKRRDEQETEPKPTYDSEIPEVDSILESSMEDRFDPDEAYETSSTPSHRD